MECFLSVGQGSVNESRFLELHYIGSDQSPICLVGKGMSILRLLLFKPIIINDEKEKLTIIFQISFCRNSRLDLFWKMSQNLRENTRIGVLFSNVSG